MPNASVSAAGGALTPMKAIHPASFNLGGRSPLDIVTMPSGDPVQIAMTALRHHTAALNALRFGAEAELAANIFARVELEGLIERLISALDLLAPDDEIQEDAGDESEGDWNGLDLDLEATDEDGGDANDEGEADEREARTGRRRLVVAPLVVPEGFARSAVSR